MEGIGQILILVVLVAASIVQQSLKAKKKRQENGETVNPEKKSPFEDVWKGLFEPEEEQPARHSPYVFNADEDSKETAMVREYENRGPDTPRGRGGEPSPQHNKTKPQTVSSPPLQVLSVEDVGESEFLKDFDARKAIIYSEIMTPKFREGER